MPADDKQDPGLSARDRLRVAQQILREQGEQERRRVFPSPQSPVRPSPDLQNSGAVGSRVTITGQEDATVIDPATYLDLGDEWGASDTGESARERNPRLTTQDQASGTQAGGPASYRAATDAAPERAPEARQGHATVRGIARSVQLRSDGMGMQGMPSTQVMTFRVEAYDALGNRLSPVPVELRGIYLSGQVSEGDEVQVTGVWRNGILQANATTTSSGAKVSARYLPTGRPRWLIGGVLTISMLFGLLVGGYLVHEWFWGQYTKVPQVVGMNEPAARIALDKVDLSMRDVKEPSDSVPAGQVIRSDPAPGTKIKEFDTVAVFVSSGSNQIAVPDVAGKDAGAAALAIQQAGLSPSFDYERSPTTPTGRVIRTDPPAGSSARKAAAVTLFVSTGRGL